MLENLMAEQIPLLEIGIKIHDEKKSDKLKPLHERLTIMFREMKENVESKYGQRALGPEFKFRNQRRHSSVIHYRNSNTPTINTYSSNAPGNRNSNLDPRNGDKAGNNEGDASTSTPVTKSKSNLMSNFKVHRKRSRASEERTSSIKSNQIR
jgi:hypothetical protein